MTGASSHLLVGIDVGSTTAKVAALDADTRALVFSRYRRHHAQQAACASALLAELRAAFPRARVEAAVTGSGGTTVARLLDVPYVQEVVANALAIGARYPQARCAIELGGQDAKMIFFAVDAETGKLGVADMRMNGSCAGGTGAFVDEIATVLNVPVEKLDALAARGTALHSISGRCGVYAKTDIQPLLNQGVPKEDVALSSMHAIAKQTIGGLAQGIDIEPPVIFEGGPLTFNPTLVRVFAERLSLAPADVIIPEHPEIMVALGAAIAARDFPTSQNRALSLREAAATLASYNPAADADAPRTPPLFATDEELAAFEARHAAPPMSPPAAARGDVLRAYLGVDSGSTTTKLVLLGEDGEPFDSFYASNEGEPLDVARAALANLRDKYRERGVELEILGAGSTGYGELMFAQAFHFDYHAVETVAHARAAQAYLPDVSFVLDIGGQDMKAIWMDHGVITDILMNEACSSGCGSFLENFATTLGIPVEGIAEMAFSSESPAALGSRCTVFMNSSVVTEQRNGKTPADIMAGLCASIVENVFTKVIRVSNLDALGDAIMVQGGTFANDAVLAAFERYVGREVTRAPYPGLMGAIGVALLTKEHLANAASENAAPKGAGGASRADSAATETAQWAVSPSEALPEHEAPLASFGADDPHQQSPASTFIGLDALDDFSYEQQTNLICPFCANHCSRTRVAFADGTSWVTGNRCPKGEVIGDAGDEGVREQVRARAAVLEQVPNLFALREELLFDDWFYREVAPARNLRIGLPRVLALWDTAPFWRVLFASLGFVPVFSRPSTRRMYEGGLAAVTSDTICFPAKLVHGHVRDLARQKVDRIFMPIITAVEPEGTADTAESMCAVVKGYPMVMRASDNPEERFGIPFDTPLFHWYRRADRDRQLTAYLARTFDVAPELARAAIEQADAALRAFRATMRNAGEAALKHAEDAGTFAVVLASRPYQNDPLVNHDLPRMFAEQGIPVLTADAVPGVNEVDLSKSRLDIANNFHARMLASALVAARSENLEYAQVVSFGCGHDAYLSDEIIHLMHETSGKAPLVLKVDETPIEGPLRIRVRSFVETLTLRRRLGRKLAPRALADPYPVKYTRADRAAQMTVLVPNTSHAFSRMMAAVFAKQGVNAVPIDLGREEAIRLGKKHVHNDICFPAQIVIGEALAALESGRYDTDHVCIGMAKYVGDCRLTHYSALLRKALDDAGYAHVPILTNDDEDAHDLHPGFRLSLPSAMRIAFALPCIDVLEELLRKMRPYELEPGSADAAFEEALDALIEGIGGGIRGMNRGFRRGIEIMARVRYDRSQPRPRVLIVGEYLLNFHPGANRDVERYLERNGFEIIEARMTDVIRKTYFYKHAQVKEYRVDKPLGFKLTNAVSDEFFELAHDNCDRIARAHPLYERPARLPELVQASDDIVHHTFDAGEGVLIPGEILHHAARGCRTFVILQPFGCLPNHVVGRGIAKALKRRYPDAQILPLDYDPDVSFANVENRLQMLVMSAQAGRA
ncbi:MULTISPECIES: acyl-CoA dehydratase activase [unclassified Adlercreutzia]|uniref:acyl-CoA dehydratase activase n=1 Tax=unclassified Adlercreutzia TaxID=2636013 RepID=UPI0013EA6161|nr:MULTISPECIES: acyl-CoA dehydratase activase [unclassified Adlercreutzia]